MFVDSSEEKLDKLIEQIKELLALLYPGTQALTKRNYLVLYFMPKAENHSDLFKNMIFGTFDYMRAELEVVHSAEQFWVNSHDNSKIDCMIIPSAVNRTEDE